VTDPYTVLGLPMEADDETIRRRYLQLVRDHPPERDPGKFAQIRKAYDSLKNLETRLHHRLFEADEAESFEAIIQEVSCRNQRRRLSLQTLLNARKVK